MTSSSRNGTASVGGLTAVSDRICVRAYAAPRAEWVSLSSALMAFDPSGNTDDLGDFLRARPPRSKGGQRT